MNILASLRRARAASIALALIGATFGGQARSQEVSAEHLQAARTAIRASQSTVSMDIILPNIGEQVKQRLIDSRPDAAEQINAIVNDATIELATRRGDLEEEVARIYARIFTIEELKQIETFYATDAGKKLISETPVIARSMEEASRVWASGVQRDLQEAVAKKIKEAGLQ